MAFDKLLPEEQRIVLQCMNVILETSWIEDPEFHTRLGITRQQLREVIAAWPKLDDSDPHSTVNTAINNCLNELCYGLSIGVNVWKCHFDVSRQDVKTIYEKWFQLSNEQNPWTEPPMRSEPPM